MGIDCGLDWDPFLLRALYLLSMVENSVFVEARLYNS